MVAKIASHFYQVIEAINAGKALCNRIREIGNGIEKFRVSKLRYELIASRLISAAIIRALLCIINNLEMYTARATDQRCYLTCMS